jgi:hypothetical protein
LTLYIVFFLPGVFALTYAGYFYAAESWAINEHSNVTADGPPVYPFKTIIPIAGAFLFAQGIVEIVRCVICLKQGDWPSRIQDVEEVSRRSGPGQPDRVRDLEERTRRRNYELGGDYEFGLAGGRLKLIGLHRFTHTPFRQTLVQTFADATPTFGQRFSH